MIKLKQALFALLLLNINTTVVPMKKLFTKGIGTLKEKSKAGLKSLKERYKEKLYQACLDRSLEDIQYYLTFCRFSPNTIFEKGNTLLHIASKKGDLEIVTYLVESAKADATLLNHKGLTPLDYACKPIGDKHLIYYSCLAESRKNVAKYLVQETKFPLLAACARESFDTIGYLIEELSYPIDERNSAGSTALDFAVQKKNPILALYLLKQSTTLVNNKNTQNYTPLHWACFFGDLKMIILLLRYGASLDTVNKNKQTPQDLAKQENHQKVVAYLKNYKIRKTETRKIVAMLKKFPKTTAEELVQWGYSKKSVEKAKQQITAKQNEIIDMLLAGHQIKEDDLLQKGYGEDFIEQVEQKLQKIFIKNLVKKLEKNPHTTDAELIKKEISKEDIKRARTMLAKKRKKSRPLKEEHRTQASWRPTQPRITSHAKNLIQEIFMAQPNITNTEIYEIGFQKHIYENLINKTRKAVKLHVKKLEEKKKKKKILDTEAQIQEAIKLLNSPDKIVHDNTLYAHGFSDEIIFEAKKRFNTKNLHKKLKFRNLICPICRQYFKNQENVAIAECKHAFHFNCLKKHIPKCKECNKLIKIQDCYIIEFSRREFRMRKK